jgi:hypothetical protein
MECRTTPAMFLQFKKSCPGRLHQSRIALCDRRNPISKSLINETLIGNVAKEVGILTHEKNGERDDVTATKSAQEDMSAETRTVNLECSGQKQREQHFR